MNRALPLVLLTAVATGCALGATTTSQPTASAQGMTTDRPTAVDRPTATAQPAIPEPTGAPTLAPTVAPRVEPSYAPPTTAANGITTIDLPDYDTIILAGDDALWAAVLRPTGRDILRIDPQTNTWRSVLADLPVGRDPIHGLAVNGSLWVSGWDSDGVTEYDATTGEELSMTPTGSDPIEPYYAFNDVWILNHHNASISRVDTQRKRVVATIDLPSPMHPIAVTEGGGVLWFGGPQATVIHAVDPETNSVARTIDTGTDCVRSLAYIGGRLWVRHCFGSDIEIRQPNDGKSVAELGDEFGELGWPVSNGRFAWVPLVDTPGTELLAIDGRSLEAIQRFELPVPATDGVPASWNDLNISMAFGDIWIQRHGELIRIPANVLPKLP